MGIDSEASECIEADKLIFLIFYIICTIRNKEQPQLGARLIEECTYIDHFMHEEQLGLIMQYTNIQHLKTCLHYLEKGIASCEKNFINVNEEGGSDSNSSSDSKEEEKTAEAFNL